MFKLFRRYNKWILVVGGTLLLVAFLIPEAIQGISRARASSGATWATVGNDKAKVTAADLELVHQELQVLESLSGDPAVQVLRQLGVLRRPEHWYLLVREARLAGLIGGPGIGRAYVASISNISGRTSAEIVGGLAGQSKQSPQKVYETLAKFNGVIRLLQLNTQAPRISDRRMQEVAAEQLSQYAIDLVVIRPDGSGDVPEPTEQELEEHLKKFGDTPAGKGEMGLGYKIPHRAKVEWISIPRIAVRATVEASKAVDGVALAKYWQQHPEEFPPDPQNPGQGFEAVRDKVRAKLVDQITDEKLQQIAKFGTDQATAPLLSLARDGIHFKLPDDWASKAISFPSLAESIAKEFEIPFPAYTAAGDRWLDETAMSNLPGIGRATTTKFGTRPYSFSRLVVEAKELGNSETIPMQKGVTGPPLFAGDGSLYFFRITDVDPAHAPKSVDEVRDQLVRDIKRVRQFEDLKARADELRNEAIERGLISMAVEYNSKLESVDRITPKQVVSYNGQQFTLPVTFGSLQICPEAVDKLVDGASTLPRTIPFNEIPLADRVVVAPIEAQLAIAVMRIENIKPLTVESYQARTATREVQSMVSETLLDTKAMMDRFGYDAMATRHEFRIRSEGSDKSETDAVETS